MRRLLFVLLFSLLGLAAAAQESPRDWVLTIQDLQAKWPAHYRFDPAFEKIQSRDQITSKIYSYRYFDKQAAVMVVSQVHKEASTLRAQVAFGTFQFAAGHNANEAVDYSNQVKAGEASQCRCFQKGGTWLFACRQKRAWAYVVIGGVKLTPQEMTKIVRSYATRLDAVQVAQKRVKRKGIWRF